MNHPNGPRGKAQETTRQTWHTTRPHDPGCDRQHLPGAATCRYGEVWPTLSLLPGESEKNAARALGGGEREHERWS